MFGQLGIVGGGGAGRSGFSPLGAALDIAFRDGIAVVNGIPRTIAGTTTSQNYPVVGSFSRPSAADWITVTGDGLETQAGNNVLRRGPVRGALFEEGRTNSIRNNTMVGAATGAPGTLPTNWTTALPAIGLSGQVVSIGNENGINYIDYRISGTPSSSTNVTVLTFDTSTGITAANGQTWTASVFVALAGGSAANISSISLSIVENTAVGAFVTSGSATIATPTSAALGAQRPSHTRTLSGGGTVERVQPALIFAVSSGLAVDITLRIGLPQIEQGTGALSPIRTTSGPGTRASDVMSFLLSVPTSGAIVFIGRTPSAAFSPRMMLQLDDGTNNNSIRLFRNSVGQSFGVATQAFVSAVQTSLALAGSNELTLGARFAMAARWEPSTGVAHSVNGATVTQGASGTMPTISRLQIGNGAAGQWGDYIERIVLFPTVPNNVTLQQYATLSTWGG